MDGSGEMTGDSTRCVHSSLDPEVTTGSVHTPIFQTSTYVQKDFSEHLGYEYARGDNPTRNALQPNPVLPDRVGKTQSNISIPLLTAPIMSDGVPTPIK